MRWGVTGGATSIETRDARYSIIPSTTLPTALPVVKKILRGFIIAQHRLQVLHRGQDATYLLR